MTKGTYRNSVLLVGRSGGWRELRGVGGSQLQAVALYGSILGHVGEQGFQRHVLLFPQVVSCHHTANKVHLRKQSGKYKNQIAYIAFLLCPEQYWCHIKPLINT